MISSSNFFKASRYFFYQQKFIDERGHPYLFLELECLLFETLDLQLNFGTAYHHFIILIIYY